MYTATDRESAKGYWWRLINRLSQIDWINLESYKRFMARRFLSVQYPTGPHDP